MADLTPDLQVVRAQCDYLKTKKMCDCAYRGMCGNYCIRPNYHTYPYKRTVKRFRSLQITIHVIYLFIKAYVVGTHFKYFN